MTKILQISMECYPAAKAGGMGDVVGALPKYLNRLGFDTAVLIPKHRTPWLDTHPTHVVWEGSVRVHHGLVPYRIEYVEGDPTGFPLFVANIPGLFDRSGIYLDPSGRGWHDEVVRHLVFQQAALQWVQGMAYRPDVLHCHDHHTGLIPFMVKHCPDYRSLAHIPTVFTIHNGAYHGAFSWELMYLLPWFDAEARGLLDWNNAINPLAAAIKCCWAFTTVSPGYLDELRHHSNGLEWLINHEWHKAHGILNGIDTDVWNPRTDPLIYYNLKGNAVHKYKEENKLALAQRFRFDPELPVITYIGRMAREKGADLLPDLIGRTLGAGLPVSWLVLGSGDHGIENRLRSMMHHFHGRFDAALEYNEALAHQLYAGSDFLIMPSRVEPCGLNQMYAARYGTVPIVRAVGGLRDTVVDYEDQRELPGARGVQFTHFTLDDAAGAVWRALQLYQDQARFRKVRTYDMKVDFSWERSAREYGELYRSLLP